MSHEADKKRIIAITKAYREQHSAEYKAAAEEIAIRRSMLANDFATMAGGDMRGIHEMPDTLHELLIAGLSLESLQWFKTTEGARWFAKTFPEWSLPQKI